LVGYRTAWEYVSRRGRRCRLLLLLSGMSDRDNELRTPSTKEYRPQENLSRTRNLETLVLSKKVESKTHLSPIRQLGAGARLYLKRVLIACACGQAGLTAVLRPVYMRRLLFSTALDLRKVYCFL